MLIKFFDSFRLRIPFIATRTRALSTIVKNLELNNSSVLYDLGCGDGTLLLKAKKSFPSIKAVGVERGIMPYVLSRIKTLKKDIHIEYKDILDVNLSEATHIYCYLSDTMMTSLKGKIMEECRVGTRILSCDFPVSDWNPEEVIFVGDIKDKLTKNIYVYVKK